MCPEGLPLAEWQGRSGGRQGGVRPVKGGALDSQGVAECYAMLWYALVPALIHLDDVLLGVFPSPFPSSVRAPCLPAARALIYLDGILSGRGFVYKARLSRDHRTDITGAESLS